MSIILVDRIGKILFHNGILRVDCIVAGPNNEERPAGTLLIPANRAAAVLNSLIGAAKELDQRLRGQARQSAAAKSASPPSAEDAVSASPPPI
jgi:hypothetical protein